MLLHEIHTRMNAITVRVDQEFSDMTLEFDIIDEWEDISQVPEQLQPLVYVITPIDSDYRGQSDELAGEYANSPELGYYVGVQSKKVYQQDLLNEPNVVSLIRINQKKLMALIQWHAINEPHSGQRH